MSIKPYIGANELREIVPVSYRVALEIVKQVEEEMQSEGLPTVKSKRKLVPTKRVLQKLGLEERDVNYV